MDKQNSLADHVKAHRPSKTGHRNVTSSVQPAMDLFAEIDAGMRAWCYHLFANNFVDDRQCGNLVFDGCRAIAALSDLHNNDLFEALDGMKLFEKGSVDRQFTAFAGYLTLLQAGLDSIELGTDKEAPQPVTLAELARLNERARSVLGELRAFVLATSEAEKIVSPTA